MSIEIIVNGAAGRMGQELIGIVEREARFNLSAAVDPADSRYLSSLSEIKASSSAVVVDFSLALGFAKTLEWARSTGHPLVSGTTGLTSDQLKEINQAGQDIAVLWSPNMSLGVAVLNSVIQQLGVVADSFDFQVEEFHHRHKVDTPSGTAKLLQQTLENTLGRKLPEAVSVRGGGIFGVHKVWAMSEEETLCIEHTALNRAVFARGALKAAEWLVNQPPGVYSIKNVLGLPSA